MIYQADILKGKAFLQKIIKKQVDEKELNWLNQQETKLQNQFQLRSFYMAFSAAPRFIGKAPLQLTAEEVTQADQLRKGFQPQGWTILQTVRVYFLLMLPHEDATSYQENLARLYDTADMEEQVALYSALPLLPDPENRVKRATQGLRTNITDIFDAIALHNPYPKDFFDRDAWNQMVLKAVFMQRPLFHIEGGDERANQDMSTMLIDFAHERWAAHRKVLPELWRFVGPFINKENFTDIEKVVNGEPLEKKAGLLACSASDYAEAQQLLDQYPEIKKEIESGRLNWNFVGEEYLAAAEA